MCILDTIWFAQTKQDVDQTLLFLLLKSPCLLNVWRQEERRVLEQEPWKKYAGTLTLRTISMLGKEQFDFVGNLFLGL